MATLHERHTKSPNYWTLPSCGNTSTVSLCYKWPRWYFLPLGFCSFWAFLDQLASFECPMHGEYYIITHLLIASFSSSESSGQDSGSSSHRSSFPHRGYLASMYSTQPLASLIHFSSIFTNRSSHWASVFIKPMASVMSCPAYSLSTIDHERRDRVYERFSFHTAKKRTYRPRFMSRTQRLTSSILSISLFRRGDIKDCPKETQ